MLNAINEERAIRRGLIVLGSAFLVWLSFLLAYWPALFSWDGLGYFDRFLNSHQYACGGGWESVLYSCWLELSLYVGLFLPSLIQVSVAALIMARCDYVLKSIGFCVLMIALPLNGFMAIYTERDILFAWLCLLWLAELTLLSAKEHQQMSWQRCIYLSSILATLVAIRIDALVLVIISPLQVYYLAGIRRKYLLRYMASLMGLIVLICVVLPHFAGSKTNIRAGANYSFNAFVYPLYYILHKNPAAANESELQILEQTLDMARIRAQPPEDLNDFKMVKRDLSSAGMSALQKAALQIIIRNPNLFFAHRLAAFKKMFDQGLFYNGLFDGNSPLKRAEIIAQFDLTKQSRWPWLRERLEQIRSLDMNVWPNMFFWRPFLAVAITFLLLLFAPLLPRLGMLHLGMGLYFLVVVLTQPTGKSKYLYSLVLTSLFMLPLISSTLAPSWRLPLWKPKSFLSGKAFIVGALKISLSFFFVYFLIRSGFQLLNITALPQVAFWGIGFVVLCHFFITVLATLRWQLISQSLAGHKVSLYRFFLISWLSQFIGLIFFGILGADAVRVWALTKSESFATALAFKSVVMDRIVSLLSLLYILAFLIGYQAIGDFAIFSVLLFCYVPKVYRSAFAISVVSHLLKSAMILILALNLYGSADLQFFAKSLIGLLPELVPISWEGLGLGHWSFAFLLGQNGVELYDQYFYGKLAFKILGFGSALIYWREFWQRNR